MSFARALWQYDFPRQSLKAFLIGLVFAFACGLIMTFIVRVPPSRVAEVVEVGEVKGRAEGFSSGLRVGEAAGRRAAGADFERLAAEGSFDEGRTLAYDDAWNEAIEVAIERAAHTPVVQLRRLDYWESLRR
ncbi:MAG: hypothetical protein OXG27_08390 [Chloroflexi bacterium]|nr:hypothetical protein [Chloroflexota bacterium]